MDRKKNFEAVLQAIALNKINVEELITERIDLHNYQKIYSDMNGNNAIASILVYPEKLIAPNRLVQIQSNQFYPSKGTIGIIGSGNLAADNFFKGLIAEVIVFDRALKKEEAESVMKYLQKKYGIKDISLATE